MSEKRSERPRWTITRDQFPRLIELLWEKGHEVIGPTIDAGAVIYDKVTSAADLPIGWTDEQDGGVYRLKRRADAALFGYSVGPHSWKRVLHPPLVRLLQAQSDGVSFTTEYSAQAPRRPAFLGVRPCDLQAIAVLDKVFLQDAQTDPTYQAHRQDVFVIAVNCGSAGGTCFCASMGTGPGATFGFDLALTEVLENGQHYFVVEVGSDRGAALLRELSPQPANEAEQERAQRIVAQTAQRMGRTLDTHGVINHAHRAWPHECPQRGQFT